MESVRVQKVEVNGRYGISRGNGHGSMMLSPGVTDVLPGWFWLTGRDHPQVELSFSISKDGVRYSATLRDAKPGIVNELCRAIR